MAPSVTFCVPTIPGRESLLSRCLFSLTEQAAGHDDRIDILVVEGTGKLGDKVNTAVMEAEGGWFTVVDDDDWLAACYLDTVLPLLYDDPDYVGLKVLELGAGQFASIAVTSGESKSWVGPIRLPVPKGVTRTSIAQRVEFGNHYTADRDWAEQVSKLVKSWRFVDRCLYIYDYWRRGSAYGGGAHRDVGQWPFDKSLIRRIRVD